MPRRAKGSRPIVVRDLSFRWRAAGTSGLIGVSIWAESGEGRVIEVALSYRDLPVTGRLVRQVIEEAIDVHGYDPLEPGAPLTIPDGDRFYRPPDWPFGRDEEAGDP